MSTETKRLCVAPPIPVVAMINFNRFTIIMHHWPLQVCRIAQVALQRQFVQPSPNHEGLAVQAVAVNLHQVHHDGGEYVQPGAPSMWL